MSAGVATVDRAIASSGATGGEGYMGGQATNFQRAICNVWANLYIIYVKAGSYTYDTWYSEGSDGTNLMGNANRPVFEAFVTTPGDLEASSIFAPVTITFASTITNKSTDCNITSGLMAMSGFTFVNNNSHVLCVGNGWYNRCNFGGTQPTASGGVFTNCVADRTGLSLGGYAFLQCSCVNCAAINFNVGFEQAVVVESIAYNCTYGFSNSNLLNHCVAISCTIGLNQNWSYANTTSVDNIMVNCTYAVSTGFQQDTTTYLTYWIGGIKNYQYGCTNNTAFTTALANNPFPNAAGFDFRPATNSAVATDKSYGNFGFDIPRDKGHGYYLSAGGGGAPKIGSRIEYNMGNTIGIFSPGDAVDSVFPVTNTAGAGVSADVTPIMSVWRNGVVDGGVSVTLPTPSTGSYRYQFTIPGGYAVGDLIRAQAQVTVGGIVFAPTTVFETRLSSSIASRSVAGDAMALTGGERTTLYAGIWANGTRTLTGFGTLVADIATAVWGAATRTLTAISDSAGITTLLSRLTSTRSGYLDNLNTSGIVASQADITALNQSASRRITLACVGTMERPETGTNTFTVELRTYDGDGAATNATGTPTITPTGIVSGSLAANLGAVSNPSTGVYRAIYTVASAHVTQEVRFDGSAVLADGTFTMSAISQVADFVAANFSTADRTTLADILALADALPLISEIRADIERSGGLLDLTKVRALLGIPAAAPGASLGVARVSDLPVAPDNAGIAAGAASAATAATQSTTAATQATNAAADSLAAKNRVLTALPNAASGTNPGLPLKSDLPAAAPTVGEIQAGTSLADLATMVTGDGTGGAKFTVGALENAPTGGGGSSGIITRSGPSIITAVDSGIDGMVGLFVGDRYSLTLRALIGTEPPGGTGADWLVSTTDEATGAAISTDAIPTMIAEELGYMAYALEAGDTVSSRRVRLTAKRTLGTDVRIFGPLVLNVRDR
ncbi:hypothetical protein [Armatimonas sp.]|uniref:hypothetical protein n=1 Tax=Armatimonas sp. TaxID=1872638 RepID=UPI0037528F37